MKTVEELRQLADVIGKATPGEWKRNWHGNIGPVDEDGNVIPLFQSTLDVNFKCNITAMLTARNSEALLRQAADELDRLRKVVDQAIDIVREHGGELSTMTTIDGYIAWSEWESQGGVHKRYPKRFNAPELAAELEARP